MDRQRKNESSGQGREELLARRVAEALDQRAGPSGAKRCPDADIIAAYAEQALASDESAQCETHFAECSRCRTILRVLTASADTPLAEKEVARLGELVAATRAPAQVPQAASAGARPRLIDWRVRWLAPALGAAAAIAVLLVLRPLWRAPLPSNSETLIAQAPKQELPPPPAAQADRLSRIAPPGEEKSLAAPKSEGTASPSASTLNSYATSPMKERAESGAPSGATASHASEPAKPSESAKKFSAMQQNAEIQPPAGPSASSNSLAGGVPASAQSKAKGLPNSPPVGGAQLDEQAKAVATEGSREKQAATAQGGAASNVVAGPARQQVTAEVRSEPRPQVFALARPLQKDSGVLKAASGSALWRAGSGGSIERSLDGGKTWAPQASPSQEDWLVGAAVSDTVCWLVGRRGAIARTLDGDHWERVSPPALPAGPNGTFPDWVSVTAVDSQTATIASSDGRKFTTSDGGKAWLQQ